MTKDQRTVAIGAVAGLLFMIASMTLLPQRLSAPIPANGADRLAYALRWDALAAVPFLLMLITVGNARFLSKAIDPTIGAESQRLIVNGRVADNTTQQLLLFLVASLALSLVVAPDRLSTIAAAAITFVAARLAFWAGYLIRPVHRAFGFAATGSLNVWLLGSALWLSLR
ncbi:MAG TPA: MAPEG family protein [Sphingomicrobium sp.]